VTPRNQLSCAAVCHLLLWMKTKRPIWPSELWPTEQSVLQRIIVLRILSCCWLGLPPQDGRLFALGTAAVTTLGYEREIRVITRLNGRLTQCVTRTLTRGAPSLRKDQPAAQKEKVNGHTRGWYQRH